MPVSRKFILTLDYILNMDVSFIWKIRKNKKKVCIIIIVLKFKYYYNFFTQFNLKL